MSECIKRPSSLPLPEGREAYTNKVLAVVNGSDLKCFVQTFGCQQNEADSERIAGMAVAMGYTITADPNEADLIVVNTCAVREHAEKKALSLIGQYKHCKNNKTQRYPHILRERRRRLQRGSFCLNSNIRRLFGAHRVR